MKNLLIALITLSLGISCSNPKPEKESVRKQAYRNFQYVAEDPINGVLKGVILLGGAGFDSFIVLLDSANNWTLEKATYGESNVLENKASLENVKQGLENYIKTFIEAGIDVSNIHFLISSTAVNNDSLKPLMSALKEIGYLINEVTPAKEAAYGYLSTMPKGWENEGYVLDMGSGNTKISWMESEEIKSVTVYGSKYHLLEVTEEEVLKDLDAKIEEIPNSLRDKCFLIGGAPYQLAKASDEYSDRYTVLKDLNEYSFLEDQKAQNGLKILKHIQESTGTREFIFDWNSNFSIGFLIASQINQKPR